MKESTRSFVLNGRPVLPIVEQPGGSSIRGPHRLGAFSLCRRRGQYRYHMERVPNISKPEPKMGTILHLHQAYYWTSRMVALGIKPPDWYYNTDMMAMIHKEATGYPELITRAEDCIKAFKERFKSDQWVPVAVEREFMVALEDLLPTCEPSLAREVVSVRTDLVVETPKGWKIFVDYKSIASAWQGQLPRWDPDGKYKIDWQIGLNLAIIPLAEPTWKLDTGIIQRILQVPPFLADRSPVRYPKSFYEDMGVTVQDCIQEERRAVEEASVLGMARKNGVARDACHMGWSFSDDRHSAGRPCEYRDLCLAESQREFDNILVTAFKEREK